MCNANFKEQLLLKRDDLFNMNSFYFIIKGGYKVV